MPQWFSCHRPSSYSATLQIRWNAWNGWGTIRVRNSRLGAETPRARKRKKKQDWNSMNNKGWLIIHYESTSALLGWWQLQEPTTRETTQDNVNRYWGYKGNSFHREKSWQVQRPTTEEMKIFKLDSCAVIFFFPFSQPTNLPECNHLPTCSQWKSWIWLKQLWDMQF